LYPGVALLEQTNVSVGRGTQNPFEIVGAPWVEAAKLSDYMNGRKIAGASFTPAAFTPVSSTLAGKNCQGVKITVTERDALDAPVLGIELAAALLQLYPKQFESAGMKSLLANDAELKKLQRGDDPKRITAGWQRSLRSFRKARRQYLLYPELL
jgi:uncharacterized protein YbbC (DUF1343 family)